ncbi:MAG: outer membrane beta-barrel protein [Bryobacteraceae bacterium]
MLKTFLFLIVLASAARAELFSFGVKVGAPLGDAYRIANSSSGSLASDATQYTVGAMAELHLPLGLGVEGDILYNRFNFSTENLLNSLSKANSNSFEFPILVKYRFAKIGPVSPFIGAGPNFRRIQSVLRFDPRVTNDSGGAGFVLAGGVEIKLLFLRIAPELRYTHWGSQSFLDAANVLIQGKQSQGQFLVGISF